MLNIIPEKGPKYRIIEHQLLEMIKTGKVAVGEQVPTEEWISKTYNVSRHTARKAVENLENGGYVERTAGRGTFVRNWRVETVARRTLRKDIALISVDGKLGVSDSWTMRVLHTCSSEAEKTGYHVTFCSVGHEQVSQGYMPLAIREKTVGGAIIDGFITEHFSKSLKEHDLGCLLLGTYSETYGLPSVCHDVADMMFKITRDLIGLEHGPVWYVSAEPTIHYMQLLYEGYKRGIFESDGPVHILRANMCKAQECSHVVRQMAETGQKRHSIIVTDPDHLETLLDAMKVYGIDPADVLFVGIGRYHARWPLTERLMFCEVSAELLAQEAIRKMTALCEKGEKLTDSFFKVEIKKETDHAKPLSFGWSLRT